MYILSIHSGGHDSAAALFKDYDLLAAVHQERLTRKKCDGRFPDEAIDEVLRIAGITKIDIEVLVLSRNLYPAKYFDYSQATKLRYSISDFFSTKKKYKDVSSRMKQKGVLSPDSFFAGKNLLQDKDFSSDTEIYFANHHFAHALSAFFYTDWGDALLYTADGGGDNVHYSVRVFKDGVIKEIYGNDNYLLQKPRVDSLGLAYGFTTQALGFKINRHEGKLTGLAAYGKPTVYEDIAKHFRVEKSGEIFSDFSSNKEMREEIFRIAKGQKREDVAASIQRVLEDFIFESVNKYVKKYKVRHLALAGGVFANVRLNKLLCEKTGVDEVFIFPAMGDDGLSVGGALEYLLKRDGIKKFSSHRCRLENVYLGGDYSSDAARLFEKNDKVRKVSGDAVSKAAELLEQGKVGAIFSTRMEFGPRALGARTILASPTDKDINDILNERLNRTEFMPFAPYVLDEDAEEVFDVDDRNRYASRFMTITTDVKDEWKDKIPAVVHVDGTARPQIITENDNKLYAGILREFKSRTGIPVLVNTSFNAHEEPIVNRPEECLGALLDGRIDFVVLESGVYQVAS